MISVMVFGVFDGLHEGHIFFLEEALRSLGEEGSKGGKLIIVVARDASVLELKKKKPQLTELARKKALEKSFPDAVVVLGDRKQGSYKVVKRHRPDVIVLGYDQKALEQDLRDKLKYDSFARVPKL